ncbi:hypothetical protein QYF36_015954 [Acer negundo]|nr:hypothetical protein QYF36_015954 [Acer negundo]
MLEMGHFCNLIDGLKPALMMVVVQVVFAGVNVFYKLAANDGMSLQVIVAYRFIFAAAFMIPLALVLERNSRPKLTWTILFQAFLCSFLLDEKLHLGSILGSMLIICGLYAVLWGKGKEMKKITQLVPSIHPKECQSIEIIITSPIVHNICSNNNKNKDTNGDIINEEDTYRSRQEIEEK